MPNRKLTYQVDADTSDAEQGFRRLGRAGDDAARDLEHAFDGAESAGSAMVKTLKQQATALETELKGTAEAVDAITTALRDVDPTMDLELKRPDIEGLVADLRKVGLTFDDIKLEAQGFAQVVKQTDDIKLDAARAQIKGLGTELDNARDHGDQSRSVLANLAGNAAQDLGELGGVVGSLGVGIGQLAEYAVDGNIAMSNLAKVAGPMAALSVALAGVNAVMGRISATKAFDQEQAEGYAEALRGASSATEAIRDHLAETGEIIRQSSAISGLNPFDTDELNIVPLLEQIGIEFEQINAVIQDTGPLDNYTATMEGTRVILRDMSPELVNLQQAMEAANVPIRDQMEIINGLKQEQQRFADGTSMVTSTSDLFASSLESINQALVDARDPLSRYGEVWDELATDLRDGSFNTEDAAANVDKLAAALGISSDEVVKLAQQHLDQQLADEADAAREAADAQREAADAAREHADAIAQAGDEIAGVMSNLPDLAGELAAALDVGDAPVDLQVLKAGLHDQLDELKTFIADNGAVDWGVVLGGTGDIDLTGGFDASLANLITGVRDQFQTGIVDSFKAGGQPAAQAFLDSFLPILASSDTGLSVEGAYRLLGLPEDGSLDLVLKPIIEAAALERATAILDSIAGVDPGNPLVAALQIAVATGDIPAEIADVVALVAAQSLGIPVNLEGIPAADIVKAQTYLRQHPVTLPAELDTDQAATDADGFRRDQASNPATIPVDADDHDARTTTDDFVAEPRTTTVDVDVNTLVAAALLVAFITQPRTVKITAQADVAVANLALGILASPRTAPVSVSLPNLSTAETLLNNLARDRFADVYVRTHQTGGGSTGGGGSVPRAAGVTGFAATAAPTAVGASSYTAPAAFAVPVATTFAPTVNVNAAVIGSPHDVRRAVTKAMRQSQRLGGWPS